MAFSKIIFNGTTLIDLTSDTVATDNLISPNTAHNNAGVGIVGNASSPSIVVTEEQLSGGGIAKHITAVDISDTTAIASDVAVGKYFYTASGVKTAGTSSGGGIDGNNLAYGSSDITAPVIGPGQIGSAVI